MKTALPHALPYVVYVATGSASALLGDWTSLVCCAVTGLLLVWFYRRGAYAELRAAPTAGQVAAAVVAGLAVAAAWVPLSLLVPPLPWGARDAMEPSAAPQHAVAARLVTMVLVGPVMEELLVRSLLPRIFDAAPDEDWRERPVGVFTHASAAVSVGFFTLTHPEWFAALLTGVAWTVFLAKTRNLRAVVLSHQVANLGLAGYILVSGDTRWW